MIFILAFSSQSVFAEVNITNISGKTVSAEISVSPAAEHNFATAAVMPYDADESSIKIENGTIKNTFYISKETDENGNLNIDFTLPNDFENGQYIIVSYDNGKKYISRIGIYDDSFDNDLPSVNGAASAAELKNAISNFSHFRADDEIFSAHGEKISEYVFGGKPSGGYEKDEFVKTYFVAEALARYNRKDISFFEFLNEYTAYLGIDYKNTFGTLSEKGFDEADKLFSAKSENFSKNISETLGGIFEIAEIKACKTAGEISKIYLENAALRKVDMTNFNKLDEYAKESLFLEMISKISDADTLAKIDGVFLSLANENANPTSEKTSSGGGSSNRVSSGMSTSIQPVLPSGENDKFSDISSHWAKSNIEKLAAKGIINGFDDKTFKPDNKITRAEFTKIVCNAFGINGGGKAAFSDVSPSDWYYESVSAAAGALVVNGFDGMFYPSGYITREDAAVIINRILKLGADGELSFGDAYAISDYASDAVCALAENGIIKGYADETFKPKDNITRAETAVIIERAAKQANIWED